MARSLRESILKSMVGAVNGIEGMVGWSSWAAVADLILIKTARVAVVTAMTILPATSPITRERKGNDERLDDFGM